MSKIYTSEEFWSTIDTEIDASVGRFASKIRASNRKQKQHNPFTEYV